MTIYSNLTSFIRSSYNEPSAFIPLHDPRFIGNEKKYLNECIDSNFVSSVGEFVGKFEKMCADYTGSNYAVACVNGTAALHIALQLSGVQRGDEVITQALTFIATANAISYTGAQSVFLDVDRETMGLSPSAVEKWLGENTELREVTSSHGRSVICFNKNTNRRIAACVPMHTFGHPVKLDELKTILDKYNIPMVEDSAESIGSYFSPREIRKANISQGKSSEIRETEISQGKSSEIRETSISHGKGKHTGTFGKFGVLSFNGNKVITTGGGGMILTDDEELAKQAKHITTQAKVPHAWEFTHDSIGYNYRLTNIAAALGCAQLETLDQILKLKRELAEKYKDFFADSDLEFFSEPENSFSNYWLNAIITKDRKQRDELLEYTNKKGVMTRPIWELMNRLPMFEHCQTDSLENSIWYADRVVNIPSAAPIMGYGKK